MTGDRFWDVRNLSEGRTIRTVLMRRFPKTYALLSESLEEVDPLDIVYPGNPDEYSDVVRELIVILAPVNGVFELLSLEQLAAAIMDGLGRCFGEGIPRDSGRRVADVILAKSKAYEARELN